MIDLHTAMLFLELGFKYCEQGLNLEQAKEKLTKEWVAYSRTGKLTIGESARLLALEYEMKHPEKKG